MCITHTYTRTYRGQNSLEALVTNMVRRQMENALVLFAPHAQGGRASGFATIAGRHLGETFREPRKGQISSCAKEEAPGQVSGNASLAAHVRSSPGKSVMLERKVFG